MTFDLGDTVRLTAVVKNAADTAVTPSTITLTIGLPDGTSETPAVPAASPVGTFTVDYVPTQAGRHTVYWSATGPEWANFDVFDVRPADRQWIFSLRDAKEHLNISQAHTDDDEEIRAWVGAATAVVERYTGLTYTRQTTAETVAGGVSRIVPLSAPVVSVTSLTPFLGTETTYTTADVVVDSFGGIHTATGVPFASGLYTLTYVTGPTGPVPDNVTRAAVIILKHLWDTQRGTMPTDEYSAMPTGLGYAVPNRAKELLGSPLPGIA